MSRTNSPMGLCSEATKFLEQNEVKPEQCPHCNQLISSSITARQIGEYEGYWDVKYSLLRYKLKDGRTADEYLQLTEFSGGPVMFLGLQISDGTKIEWEDWEIQAYI